MKKIIQICSILSLVFVFSVGFTAAQTSRQYAVKIPFDFSIGQKSYQSGNYVIKVVRISPDAVKFSLADSGENNLQTMLIPNKGELSKSEPKLIFNRYENRRFLSKLMTKDIGLSMLMTDEEKQFAGKNRDTTGGK